MKPTVNKVKKAGPSLNPDVLKRLKNLNHETAGRFCDKLGCDPPNFWHHVNKETATLTSLKWIKVIIDEFEFKTIESILDQP